jgi:hypothetical protein
MKLAHYWCKETATIEKPDGQTFEVGCWGGSTESDADAKQAAKVKLDRIQNHFLSCEPPDIYQYASGPLQEQILEEQLNDQGEVYAALSRNRYGAVILNTQSLMIIDIDNEPTAASFWESLKSMFVKPATDPMSELVEKIHHWLQQYPDWGLRLYKTYKGFRLLITHEALSATSEITEKAFTFFDADPLYQKLCHSQDCFRARLTPKPWRCEMAAPEVHFPFEDDTKAQLFNDWLLQYELRSSSYASCHLIDTFGNTEIASAFNALVDLHDTYCSADSNKPLA